MKEKEERPTQPSPSGSGSSTEVDPQHSRRLSDRSIQPSYHRSTLRERKSTDGEHEFDEEEPADRRPGAPSQQPNSQQAHVDPGYYALNPWYGQPSDRGATFSTAFPFPRTVRPGMLNNLTPEMVRLLEEHQQQQSEDGGHHDHHDQSQRYAAHQYGVEPDLEKGHPDADSMSAKGKKPSYADTARSPTTNAHGEEIPPDIRKQERRPVPRTMPEDEHEQTKEVPADIRPESMRPTTGVPPKEEKDDRAHNLTALQSRTSQRTMSQGAMDRLQRQATEAGHTAIDQGQEVRSRELRNRWARIRAKTPEPLAEFVATTISIYIGLAGSLSKTTSNGTYGDFHTQSLSWGLGVMFGIYIAGGVSGAHLNPAVSITLSLFRGFPWRRCAVYIVAQILGGLVAGAIAFSVYHDALYEFDPSLDPATSGIAFFTLPQPFLSVTSAFFNEFVSAVILMTVLLALGDDTNAPPGAGMNAFILGLLVTVLVFCSSYQTGLALNPARDFGPRLVALWMGYPTSIFTGYNWWWLWGAWIAPLVGCITGCTVYDTMVFSGGESPLNYRWPSRKEFLRQVKGSGQRQHDHVFAHAKN